MYSYQRVEGSEDRPRRYGNLSKEPSGGDVVVPDAKELEVAETAAGLEEEDIGLPGQEEWLRTVGVESPRPLHDPIAADQSQLHLHLPNLHHALCRASRKHKPDKR